MREPRPSSATERQRLGGSPAPLSAQAAHGQGGEGRLGASGEEWPHSPGMFQASRAVALPGEHEVTMSV